MGGAPAEMVIKPYVVSGVVSVIKAQQATSRLLPRDIRGILRDLVRHCPSPIALYQMPNVLSTDSWKT
jgi:hypothetical protein